MTTSLRQTNCPASAGRWRSGYGDRARAATHAPLRVAAPKSVGPLQLGFCCYARSIAAAGGAEVADHELTCRLGVFVADPLGLFLRRAADQLALDHVAVAGRIFVAHVDDKTIALKCGHGASS